MDKTDSENSGDTPVAESRKGCMTRRLTPWWFDWVLIPFVILILWAIGAPPGCGHGNRDKAVEAEIKSNLHEIQVAVEQYAVDTGGTYPAYLIGGEGKHSVFVKEDRNFFIAFADIQDCADQTLLADPLLRKGYLQAYPKNPFSTYSVAIHRLQEDYGDPLRNGTEEAKLHGTRFGPYCTLMGSILADFRYTEVTVFGEDGGESVFPIYADFGYPFYDIWETNKPHPFMPGEFFYRSRSVPVISAAEDGAQQVTDEVRDYMLGGYGSIRTKGRDILGPDPTGENEVSPFGSNKHGVMDYGNPNGIRDSIILVLVPPEDTRGAYD